MAAGRASRAAARPDRASVRRAVAWLLEASADPADRGLLMRGLEHQPCSLTSLTENGPALRVAVEGSLRLARLAAATCEVLREHPDAEVRRAAAVLGARAHPLLAAAEAGDGP